MFMNSVAALLRWEAANLGWVGGGGGWWGEAGEDLRAKIRIPPAQSRRYNGPNKKNSSVRVGERERERGRIMWRDHPSERGSRNLNS